MKVKNTGGASPIARGTAAGSGRVRGVAPVQGVTPAGDAASVMGIPEVELTPKVRDAIMLLMSEVEKLRNELEATKRRMGDLEDLADTDPLLPVLNRRAFVRELTRIKAFGDRYDMSSSLIYMDLNDFKEVNDTYGHAAGDQVLHDVVAIIKKQLRQTDSVGRLGGDEFGIILANADSDVAQKKALALSEKLAKHTTVYEGNKMKVSVSFGAYLIKSDEDITTMLAKADEAMYAQKKDGKESDE